MTDKLMELQQISTSLWKCVNTDDVIGARNLLEGVNELDRKSIVSRKKKDITPLFYAAIRGNVDMVECLVTEWQADLEENGELKKDDMMTPLCGAALFNKSEVVKLLIDLGAVVNAASNTGCTPILYACFKMNVDVVKCLIEHGASTRKSNNSGETCLMVAAQRSCKELCQIFIDIGVDMNAQLTSNGNTALHCAISGDNNPDTPNIVQLLIDNGADPCITNTRGDDVFRTAIFQRKESLLMKLLFASKSPQRRWIDSYRLLGSSYLIKRDIQSALSSWKKAIKIQRYFCVDVPASQPNPVYLSVQEVSTAEELETLSQNRDLVLMYALVIREKILGPHHTVTLLGLYWQSLRYRADREYQRCINVCRYALQLQNVGSNPLITSQHLCNCFMAALYYTCWFYCDLYRQLTNANNVVITFEEVLEVLQMATTNLENATRVIIPRNFEQDVDLKLIFIKLVLHLVSLITELEMHSDQQVRFKQIVYRLVRCQLKNKQGQTLLHLSVLESTSHIEATFFGRKSKRFFTPFPNIAVVKLLLECGANVNAVDDERNTALHLCSEALRNLELEQHHDMLKRIAVPLLNSSAHVDMVNIFGMRAADGLTSSFLEMNVMNFVSLKCLAANAVVKYKITQAGYVNDSLESFVQMHEICTIF